jgi:hypothetical protein
VCSGWRVLMKSSSVVQHRKTFFLWTSVRLTSWPHHDHYIQIWDLNKRLISCCLYSPFCPCFSNLGTTQNNFIECLFRHRHSVPAYYGLGNLREQHPVYKIRTSKGKKRKSILLTCSEGPKGCDTSTLPHFPRKLSYSGYEVVSVISVEGTR